MIKIQKGKEPKELLLYRQQAGASYEQLDKKVKETLLESLLREQGHLCAYCMRRIPEDRKKLPTGIPSVTIEHWFPRNPQDKIDIGQGLDYRNMFAVCSGNRGYGNKESMTCDAYRGNAPLTVNPCDPITLAGIKYTSTGRILSSDPEIDKDLNEHLNLNCERISLPENRKRALQVLIDDIHKKHEVGDIATYCERKLANINNTDDPKIPYVGILIYWLEKKLKNHK